jgi:peptide/nickel transport system permease protein
LAYVFPAAIGGSVILETIFSIPGMGSETVLAIHNQNYPMIVAVFTITALLTMTGILVSDILYAIADPRIRFGKTK